MSHVTKTPSAAILVVVANVNCKTEVTKVLLADNRVTKLVNYPNFVALCCQQ